MTVLVCYGRAQSLKVQQACQLHMRVKALGHRGS